MQPATPTTFGKSVMFPSPAAEVRNVCKAFPAPSRSSGFVAKLQHCLQRSLLWRPSRRASRRAWQVAGALTCFVLVEKLAPLLRVWLREAAQDRHLGGTDSSGHEAAVSTSASSAGSSGSSGSSGHGDAHQHDGLFFLFSGVVVGTSVTHLTTLPMFHGVQQTVVMFVLGITLAFFFEWSGLEDDLGVFGKTYTMWMDIDPHLILFTMLPALLTGDAMTLDTRIAERVAKQCIYLASVGVCINATIVAFFLWWYLPYNWSFLLSLTTGAILCATDPVAVVALLKELGASPTLTVLIQGESLLNDGTAIVLYTIPYNMLAGQDYGVSDIIIFLVKQCMCAWCLGMFIGAVFLAWICAASSKLDHHNVVIQVSLTLCCAYWSFIIAEGVFHISGVLATVAAALVLAHSMWPRVVSKKSMHDFWHMLEYLGNTIIFFLAGALTGKTMAQIPWIDYCHLMVIYLVLVVVRALLLLSSRPLLRVLSETKQPVSLAEVIVMTWGGLRGAVGLALAIVVKKDRAGGEINTEDADRVMFFVGGIAALTLVVNATTAPAIVRWLGITAMPETRRKLLLMIHRRLMSMMKEIIDFNKNGSMMSSATTMLATIESGLTNQPQSDKQRHCCPSFCRRHLQTHPEIVITAEQSSGVHFTNGDAKDQEGQQGATKSAMGHMFVKLENGANSVFAGMYKGVFGGTVKKRTKTGDAINEEWAQVQQLTDEIEEQDLLTLFQFSKVPVLVVADKFQDLLLTQVAEPETVRTIREVLLVIVRSVYWEQVASGEIKPGSPEADALFGSITLAMDMSKVDSDDFQFLDKKYLQDKWKRKATTRAGTIFMNGLRTISQVGDLVKTSWFIGFINVSIIGHCTFTLLEEQYREFDDTSLGWLVADVLFVSIFLVECILKILNSGRRYFRKHWNIFDFALVILGLFSMAISIFTAYVQTDQEGATPVLQVARVLRVLRLIRFCRVLKTLHMLADNKLYSGDFGVSDREIQRHMMKIKVLTLFVKAHLTGVDELMHCFGIESVEVARCVLMTYITIHRAILMAVREEKKCEACVVREIVHLRTSHYLTERLDEFVQEAHHAGIIAHAEADSMIKFLRDNLKVTQRAARKSINHITKANKGASSEDISWQIKGRVVESIKSIQSIVKTRNSTEAFSTLTPVRQEIPE